MNNIPEKKEIIKCDLRAEKALLGCLSMDEVVFDSCISRINSESFFSPMHGVIYKVFLGMRNLKIPIDIVTISQFVKKNNLEEKCGGTHYITECMSEVPTTANFEHYVNIVRDLYVERSIIKHCSEIKNWVELGEISGVDALSDLSSRITMIQEFGSINKKTLLSEIIPDTILEYENQLAKNNADTGLSTGYIDLDRYFLMKPGDYIIIAARPSIGKTAFAMNIGSSQKKDKHVAFFSLEMTDEQLSKRLLQYEAQVNDKIMTTEKLGKFKKSAEKLIEENNIHIYDLAKPKVSEIKALARLQKKNHGLDLIIVDYIQLIKPESGWKSGTRENELAMISQELVAMKKELKVPMLILAQLNRTAESEKPKISHLRESGSFEQDADIVILLSGERNDKPLVPRNVSIAKSRNGRVGEIILNMKPETTTFYNNEKEKTSDSYLPYKDNDIPDYDGEFEAEF